MKILASRYCSCTTDDDMITIKRQLRKNNRKLSTRTKNNSITKSPQKLDHVTDETESDWLY